MPMCVPGPPTEPKIIAQYFKIERIGSIGSIVLAILEVEVVVGAMICYDQPIGVPTGMMLCPA